MTRPRDLPVGGRRASLRWCKRRWCCDERSCRRGSFTEAVSAVPARKRMTARLRTAAGAAVADGGRTVVQSARDHEVSWPVVAAAFAAHAAAVLPEQPQPVEVLGIDEIRRGRPKFMLDEATGMWQSTVDRWHVGFCDLSGGQGLLGQVEGRTAQVVADWLLARPRQWREQVRYVAIDMCTIFKSAVGRVLPHAQLVVDHFHLVQLANADRHRGPPPGHRAGPRPARTQRQPRVGTTQPADPQRRPNARRARRRPRSRTVRATRTHRPADPDRVERQGGPARPTRAGPHRAGP